MSDPVLDRMRDVIQEDVGNRGLRRDPTRNLVSALPDDFARACASLTENPRPVLAVVTGFFIPTAAPPAGETDGPLGALFLARALPSLGIPVVLATDSFCVRGLKAGLSACDLEKNVPLIELPSPEQAARMSPEDYRESFLSQAPGLTITHLLAIERVGPSHTLASLQAQTGGALGETYLDFLHAVPDEHQDRCHTMRGIDISDVMSPAHRLFEPPGRWPGVTTLGIGDGGNEIGMGKIAWDTIRNNIPGGGLVACRVPTDHLIVCGVSNWGAYALAAGLAHLRRTPLHSRLYDPVVEQRLLGVMVEQGPLVDGVAGRPAATVDGLTWDEYARVLVRLAAIFPRRTRAE
jgi:hypothetical protein